jgi:glycerol-3-phosphate O-acyltransferase
MDVVGNFVDEKGNSFDDQNRPVSLKEFFFTNGEVVRNVQREREYTRRFGNKIIDRYFKDNLVLSSHLVAFVAFNILLAQNPNLDIYGILRLPPEDFIFPMDEMKNAVNSLREILFQMEENEEIQLSNEIHWEVEKLIRDGVGKLGTYHDKRPLKINKKGLIISEDFNVLFFYHNRLDHYGFDKLVHWKSFKLEEVAAS